MAFKFWQRLKGRKIVPQESFADLMTRWRAGDPSAATPIFLRYMTDLVRLASQRLASNIRQKIDPEELVQSAVGSFLRIEQDKAIELDGWDSLWSLLATITIRKCNHAVRDYLTDKRDVRRESVRVPLPGESSASWLVMDSGPTPAEAAVMAEVAEELLNGLDDHVRPIVELSLQGYTVAEIKKRLNLTERTVYRQLERIKAKLIKQAGEEK